MKKIAVVYLVLGLLSASAFGQVNSGLLKTLTAVAGMRERFPVEKLYLQLDKPYYSLGDTLRFKAYLLNADFLKPSHRSKLLYIELDDNTGKSLKRMMVPLASGVSWGDLALTEKEFPEGSYTLRAYTNWMLNFGDDYIFRKNIYISALSNSTLIKADFKLQSGTDKDKIRANIRFTGLDKSPLRLKDMTLRVMNGRHNLIKDKVTTGMDGSIDVNFDLADKTAVKNLAITVQEIRKDADEGPVLTIPVVLNRPENTDVQFMPEGGNLIAGIPAKIGFKAIGEDGNAANISGKVYNSKQQEVATFKSIHKGMGAFELTPQPGETYTAKVTLPGNINKSYPLPIVVPTGTTLRIEHKDNQSLEVTLNATAELLNSPDTYYLVGQIRGMICYTAPITFKGSAIKKIVGKDLFPAGIAHFTLLNSANQPLNERIFYVDHNDNLQINIAASKPNYGIRDSIALAIMVKDKDGKPVKGTFSLAVTDNSQVKADSINSNILSNLFLTSDLKGNIEEPGWYFENAPQKTEALDNLLLTQGWIGYDWKAIFNSIPQQPQFTAESEFIVQGKVTNIFNKPVEKSNIVLFSRTPQFVRDTVTDKDGKFTFRGLFPVDTAEFKIQARTKGGASFNVGIDVAAFKPPVFTTNGSIPPWYVNSDTTLLNNAKTKAAQLQAQANLRGEGHLLKEVVIKEKKMVKESHNLNGPGEADQVLDEQDILKAGKMTLNELLAAKIVGFHSRGMASVTLDSKSSYYSYVINDQLIQFVFDGVFLSKLYNGDNELSGNAAHPFQSSNKPNPMGPMKEPDRYNFLTSYMDYYSAEDIKGIEISSSSKYNDLYDFMLLGPTAKKPQFAFVEITTRGGKGPFMKLTPGTYLYKPLPFTLSKQFYRPRYTAKNSGSAMGTDLRSTIHWEPNIMTDKDGKATISFFSADKLADYTLVMEGTDLNGQLGYSRQVIKAKTK